MLAQVRETLDVVLAAGQAHAGGNPLFGNTARYYQIFAWTFLVIFAAALPIVFMHAWRVSIQMGQKSTAGNKDVLACLVFCINLLAFSVAVMMSMPIPASLQLTLEHGGSTGQSGLMVSLYFFALPSILAVRFVPSLARLTWPLALKIYLGLQLFTMGTFAIFACVGPFPGSLWCLLGSKAIGGLAHGLYVMKSREHIYGVLDTEEKTWFGLQQLTVSLMGFASGPMLGSACIPFMRLIFRDIGAGLQDLNPGAYVALVQLFWMIYLTPVFLMLTPKQLHVSGVDTADEAGGFFRQAPDYVRRWNICLIICAIFFKDMVAGALEVFDVLLLEIEYGFSVDVSGIFACMTLYLAIPGILLYMVLADSLGDWVNTIPMVGVFVPVFTSLAAYEALCPFNSTTNCVLWMLIARAICYQLWAICMGWITGNLFKWVVERPGHYATRENLAFYVGLTVEGVTRGAGPWVVRTIYEYKGRLWACAYITFCELTVCALVWLGLILPMKKYWT